MLDLAAVWRLLDDADDLTSLSVSAVAGPAAAPHPIGSADEARQTLDLGGGLVIAGLEQVLDHDDGLIATLHGLADELALPVRGITVFISPANVSLVAHNDVYEAFTVQLAGAKRWELHDIVAPGVEVTGAPVPMPGPRTDVTLQAGDVLYVPKGMIHRVETSGADVSISAALIFQPPSWTTVVEALLGEIARHPLFWRSINDADRADIEGALDVRKSMLVKAVLGLEAHDLAVES
jgi:hypothetical protein